MKIQFALCAQTVTIDRTTNRVSIFNIIDHLTVVALPIVIPTITFFAVVESDQPENNNIEGYIEISNGEELVFRVPVPINFTDHQLARVVLTFQGVPVRTSGHLSFRLVLPDGTASAVSFQVVNIASLDAVQNVVPEVHS
jgi:hypothetical protein